MEVKDALTIMFLFGSFILALLTYINNNTRKNKNPPKGYAPKVGFSFLMT
ncbi:hypothetical protein HMPREF9412_5085 [Paenibacillus sp. HGF5]|nr:hypothetical protein HMPREF9412_5085 [Paenibacillus sp. HGF5]